ncbi:phosphatase PAP2 family protein [Halosimplex aquaticum]|uniref:Phosphatase PAP2 family protein n=1 Tax=Halosimplex aquaticum TaxID=3026162 RepID=A0ABD5Y394_9EURY|nr:phosphatase PAP2 family protein [Halosimplex aquaticum]
MPGALQRANELFPYVFHPITVLALGIALLIHYEWREQSAARAVLWRRLGAFLGAGVLALVPTVAYFLVGRSGLSTALGGSSWQLDEMVASGVLIAAGTTWYVWRRYDWGEIIPDAMVTLAVVIAPYALLSPFWDISGHVLIALAPLLYLSLLDRRYVPLLAIPVLMVPNRVAVNAHTWAQSIAGFVVAAVITVGLYYLRARSRADRSSGSTPS